MDLDNEKEVCAMVDPGKEVEQLCARSMFKHVRVQQYAAALAELGAVAHPDVLRLTETGIESFLQSIIVEEVHNTMKNAGQAKVGKRTRRPERGMAVAIGKRVIHKVNRYRSPWTPPSAARRSR